MSIQLLLPARHQIRPNGPRDPLPYYYTRSLGWLYRRRLQMGLGLIPPGGQRVLEVGVGSGILVPTLTRHFRCYTGVDLVLAPGLDDLVAPGCQATFLVTDLLEPDALPEAAFDVVVCFSVLEHITRLDLAASSLARSLAPGGRLVTGYPMVNRLMSGAFRAIGCDRIDDDHVSNPRRIEAALQGPLRPVARAAIPPRAPVDLALYQCTAWTR